MTYRAIWSTLIFEAIAGTALAVAPDLSDRSFAEAAVTVMTFDMLAEQCQARGGFTGADTAKVAKWQRDNQVDRIRARIDALSQDADTRERLTGLRASMAQKLAAVGGAQSCAAAVAATRTDTAQIAARSPMLLQALGGTNNEPQSMPSKPLHNAAPAVRVTPSPTVAALAASVDSFAFDSQMQMGVGGFLYPVPVPVVLFRNGEALTDVEGLSFRGGIEAHKLAHPGDWTRWRRDGGRLQLLDPKKGWDNLAYNVNYSQLPSGYRLNGEFGSISGSGTVAIAGTDSVAAWRNYAFTPDGRVVRGGGAGGYTELPDQGSTAVSSRSAVRRGRYRIEGITLHIQYDDGSSEAHIIVTDPKDPKAAIWLDGIGYSRKSK
jgi:hypothetical protein